jgi:hypothetical protein
MAFGLDDLVESSLGLGIVGVGAILLAPTILPVAGRILRPVIKETVKGAMVVYRSAAEGVSDMVSEASAEARAPTGGTGG